MNALELTRLMGVERQGWDSLCHSTGGGFYGRLMTPDALMTSVYRVVDGEPRLALYQQTTITLLGRARR